jgi:hypothetical protein
MRPEEAGHDRSAPSRDSVAPTAAIDLEDNAVTLGPLEYIVIGFQGKQELDGSIARELEKVVANGSIRIVDLVFIARDDHDNAVAVEIDAKSDARFAAFAPLLRGSMALLTQEDIESVAATLPDDTAALVALFEHHWAVDLKDAIAEKGGFLVGRSVIPPEVLEELSEELAAQEFAAAAVTA